MTDQHPITPPPELVEQWREDWYRSKVKHTEFESYIVARAAQWGADHELEACCKWLPKLPPWSGDDLRRHRRPKPPSLKEQAITELDNAVLRGDCITVSDALPTIRRALETLDD